MSFIIESDKKEMSLQNALSLVEAADWAYEDLAKLEEKLKRIYDFNKYKYLDKKDTQAFVAGNDKILLLAFRGTTTWKDCRVDLKANFILTKYGRVHSGFNEALDCIWDEIIKTLIEFRDCQQDIWVTGHSLGGALATLAVVRLTDESFKIGGLYTFGQPRVGDKTFALIFNDRIGKRTFRFVHDEDVVTKLPPSLNGYCHVGTEMFFDRGNKLYKTNILLHKFISRCQSMSIRNSSKLKESKIQNPGGIKDHGLGGYRRCIKESLIKERGNEGTFKEYINC